jgi:hypothetical protein
VADSRAGLPIATPAIVVATYAAACALALGYGALSSVWLVLERRLTWFRARGLGVKLALVFVAWQVAFFAEGLVLGGSSPNPEIPNLQRFGVQ